jgi:O-antigen/teichoic acid export membrane protein
MHALLSRVRSWVEGRRFVKNVARLGGGTALGQGFVVLATPALTRLYSPSDIGVVELFTSFLMLAASATSLRYELAIGIAPAGDRDALTLLSCWLTVAVATAATLILGLLIHKRLLGFGALPYWSLAPMLVLLVLTGVFTALRYWHVAHQHFGGIAAALIRQGLGRALVPICCAPLGWGWGGLLAGEMAGRTLGFECLARNALPALLAARQRGSHALRSCFVRYRQFAVTFLTAGALETLASFLPVPLITTLFGVSSAGQFALAQRVMLMPGGLICGAVSDVYQGRFTAVARNSPDLVRNVLHSGIVRLGALAAVVHVPLAMLALFTFRWVFGAAWEQAALAAVALAPMAISGVVTSPLSRAMLLSRTPQVKLGSDAIRLVLPTGGLYLGSRLALSLPQTTLIYAIMAVVADAIYLSIIWYSVAPRRQLRLT